MYSILYITHGYYGTPNHCITLSGPASLKVWYILVHKGRFLADFRLLCCRLIPPLSPPPHHHCSGSTPRVVSRQDGSIAWSRVLLPLPPPLHDFPACVKRTGTAAKGPGPTVWMWPSYPSVQGPSDCVGGGNTPLLASCQVPLLISETKNLFVSFANFKKWVFECSRYDYNFGAFWTSSN